MSKSEMLKDICRFVEDVGWSNSIIDATDNAHLPCLRFNTDINDVLLSSGYSLYDQHLQDSLLKFESDKMSVTVNWLCYNVDKLLNNNGGEIKLGLNGRGSTSDKSNRLIFSQLKSKSVYAKYLFGNLSGGDLLGVYGELCEYLPDITHVCTYTIIYIVDNSTVREVTLHDFNIHGSILTTIDIGRYAIDYKN